MTISDGSEAVEVMRKAAVQTWREWTRHRVEGTVDTAEGIAAYEAMKLAAAAWSSERAGRDDLVDARRGIAVNDRGPQADLGLAVAAEEAREAA